MSKKEDKQAEVEQEVPNNEVQNDQTDDQSQNSEAEEDVVDETQEEIEALKDEVRKEKDNFLRLFAEFENYKKRTARERIELFCCQYWMILNAV